MEEKKEINVKKRLIIIITMCVVAILLIGILVYFIFIKPEKTANVKYKYYDADEEEINYNIDLEGFLMSINEKRKEADGVVIIGQIERGTVNIGSKIQLIGFDEEKKTATVKSIKVSGQDYNSATIGDTAEILIEGIEEEYIKKGQVAAKPESINNVKVVEANIYMFSKEEGGRENMIYNEYRPQIVIRTANVSGRMILPENVTFIRPGDGADVTIELASPVAIEIGNQFEIREGEKTVGRGTVTRVY